MQNKTLKPGYERLCLLISAILFFSACKRELAIPEQKNESAQPTTINARVAATFASPLTFPVQSGVITTLIGGPSNTTAFSSPAFVTTDPSGNLYVTDMRANLVKKISPGGIVLAQFGNGQGGYKDGPVASAQFNAPKGIAIAPDGRIIIADANNNRIRFINASGDSVGTLAGSGVAGFADGAGTLPKFNNPAGLAIDANGVVYIADALNNMIRRITDGNHVSRWAGQTTPGAEDKIGSLASFNNPQGIAVSPGGAVFVADQGNNKIRRIVSGTVSTYAGNGEVSLVDGPGTSASFQFPSSVAVDAAGNLYVTDFFDDVRFIAAPANTNSLPTVSTIAGQGIGYADGTYKQASFKNPSSIALSPDGNIYIVDQGNRAVRKMHLTNAVKTMVRIDQSSLLIPSSSMKAGWDGNLYAFNSNGRLLKINPSTGVAGYLGNVQLSAGSSLTFDVNNNIVAVDPVRKLLQKFSASGLPLSYVVNLDGAYRSPTVDGANNVYVVNDQGRIAKVGGVGQITYASVNSFIDFHPQGSTSMPFPGISWSGEQNQFLQIEANRHTNEVFVNAATGIYKLSSDLSHLTLVTGGSRLINPQFNQDGLLVDPASGRLVQDLNLPWNDPRFYSNATGSLTFSGNGKLYTAGTGRLGEPDPLQNAETAIYGIDPEARLTPATRIMSAFTLDYFLNPGSRIMVDGDLASAKTVSPFALTVEPDGKTIYFMDYDPQGRTYCVRGFSAF